MTNTDQLGNLLANLFVPINTGTFSKIFVMNDNGGTPRNLYTWNITGQSKFNLSQTASRVQVGKGTTPSTRQDTNIESPFIVAPENNPVDTQLFGYNSGLGKITIATQISPTGGSGAITEVVHFMLLIGDDLVGRFYLIQRDIISPVNFIIGEAIDTEHIWLI